MNQKREEKNHIDWPIISAGGCEWVLFCIIFFFVSNSIKINLCTKSNLCIIKSETERYIFLPSHNGINYFKLHSNVCNCFKLIFSFCSSILVQRVRIIISYGLIFDIILLDLISAPRWTNATECSKTNETTTKKS